MHLQAQADQVQPCKCRLWHSQCPVTVPGNFCKAHAYEVCLISEGVAGSCHMHGVACVQVLKQRGDLIKDFMQVIRGLLFVIFWPFLKRMGYGLTPTDALILTW